MQILQGLSLGFLRFAVCNDVVETTGSVFVSALEWLVQYSKSDQSCETIASFTRACCNQAL